VFAEPVPDRACGGPAILLTWSRPVSELVFENTMAASLDSPVRFVSLAVLSRSPHIAVLAAPELQDAALPRDATTLAQIFVVPLPNWAGDTEESNDGDVADDDALADRFLAFCPFTRINATARRALEAIEAWKKGMFRSVSLFHRSCLHD
jgi:hypothetical protein